MARIDFAALKRRISIEPVCDWLGIKLKKTGHQKRGPCPICEHESNRCFVITPKLGLFYCFGHCQSGGDVIELVAQVKKITHQDAARLLVKHFGEGA